jgi:hypothetical protein
MSLIINIAHNIRLILTRRITDYLDEIDARLNEEERQFRENN